MAGFSRTSTEPHAGLICGCDLIRSAPLDLRIKAQRLVAAKTILAARVDAQASPEQTHEKGAYGLSLKTDIEQRLDKLNQPPPLKTVKPLPAPKEYAKSKRAGKR